MQIYGQSLLRMKIRKDLIWYYEFYFQKKKITSIINYILLYLSILKYFNDKIVVKYQISFAHTFTQYINGENILLKLQHMELNKIKISKRQMK